jgi:hypothetical protein
MSSQHRLGQRGVALWRGRGPLTRAPVVRGWPSHVAPAIAAAERRARFGAPSAASPGREQQLPRRGRTGGGGAARARSRAHATDAGRRPRAHAAASPLHAGRRDHPQPSRGGARPRGQARAAQARPLARRPLQKRCVAARRASGRPGMAPFARRARGSRGPLRPAAHSPGSIAARPKGQRSTPAPGAPPPRAMLRRLRPAPFPHLPPCPPPPAVLSVIPSPAAPDDLVELIVQLGAVPAVVPLLTLGDTAGGPSEG